LKKIVILGASGLLGSNLCISLKSKYDIYPIINKKKIHFRNLKTKHLNLNKTSEIFNYLKSVRPDFLINCVAISNVEKCEINKKKTFIINSKLPEIIARICKKLSIHYTFISSDHLYAGKKKYYTENDKVHPLNIYSRSKILAENKILKVSKNFLIIRTNFFGFGPSFRNSFLDGIIKNLEGGRDTTLFSDVFYTPIYVRRLIRVIGILIENKKYGIFNVSGNKRLTKYEFGIKIAKKFKFNKKLIKKLYLKETLKKVLRPKDMSLSNLKVKKILNKNNLFDLSNGISQLYNDYNSKYYNEIKKKK
tara:strand:+ start:2066 stop:2983 length:918 start_codon:yes stop_codon:yes gene_type:complete